MGDFLGDRSFETAAIRYEERPDSDDSEKDSGQEGKDTPRDAPIRDVAERRVIPTVLYEGRFAVDDKTLYGPEQPPLDDLAPFDIPPPTAEQVPSTEDRTDDTIEQVDRATEGDISTDTECIGARDASQGEGTSSEDPSGEMFGHPSGNRDGDISKDPTGGRVSGASQNEGTSPDDRSIKTIEVPSEAKERGTSEDPEYAGGSGWPQDEGTSSEDRSGDSAISHNEGRGIPKAPERARRSSSSEAEQTASAEGSAESEGTSSYRGSLEAALQEELSAPLRRRWSFSRPAPQSQTGAAKVTGNMQGSIFGSNLQKLSALAEADLAELPKHALPTSETELAQRPPSSQPGSAESAENEHTRTRQERRDAVGDVQGTHPTGETSSRPFQPHTQEAASSSRGALSAFRKQGQHGDLEMAKNGPGLETVIVDQSPGPRCADVQGDLDAEDDPSDSAPRGGKYILDYELLLRHSVESEDIQEHSTQGPEPVQARFGGKRTVRLLLGLSIFIVLVVIILALVIALV